ncbi:hypothetical protein AVEN_265122-1 [Araneus ventricosus]|uniref:DUF4806 domain-containing protein n=1 Tax=Araneus ventricosus TaxID=182803 RepID=A0A4Y2NHQ5_ARAVE|nr:hypothetical protein AVEN_265122-1 [Araneus ventricosus]
METFALEEKLKEVNFRKKMILELRKLGGRNLVNIIGWILQHVMSPALAVGFSYYGTKDKLQFSTLGICEIISVERYHEKDATIYSIKEVIQNWLRHAIEKAYQAKEPKKLN